MKTKSTVNVLIMTVILGIIAILFVIPLVWMVLSSFKSTTEVFTSNFHWLPSTWKWSNYETVWTDETANMLRSYFNSFKFVTMATVGQLLIASLAGYAFAKIQFRGKNLIFMLFLASMMIPAEVTIIPRFMLFKTVGLYNNLWAVILPHWFGATAIFMLRQYYMGLPDELMEAARIDGANHMKIFSRILLPLTKPAMVSLLVLSFVACWNEYLAPLIFITDTQKFTITQVIRWYMLDDLQRYELTMAAATSAIVPVIILFLICQKYFVEGIATSGLKG